MKLLKNKRLTIIIISIVFALGTTFFTDIGYYINYNHYNTFTRDYGFPAAWLILNSEYEYLTFNILGLLFNLAFFYLLILLTIKVFSTLSAKNR
ncbi:hypothetical protein [Aureibacillus halotolerans]|uniref:YfzA-like protein n=1 Tax=Aureibacillus halotolerans TaxID=1508390 RepID=A0A4R6TPF2_9BACI|nr:hypothetical protein [Aureibacillus halotolerans]TDQ31905.1 hypothetical protein EV213_13410 [Aureibacillus halotolerans]